MDGASMFTRHVALVAAAKRRPTMYMPSYGRSSIYQFLAGWDAGTGNLLLGGLADWMRDRYGFPANIVWWATMDRVIGRECPDWPDVASIPDAIYLDTLWRIIEEYLIESAERDGAGPGGGG